MQEDRVITGVCPCKDCKDRWRDEVTSCHSSCAAYSEYKENLETLRIRNMAIYTEADARKKTSIIAARHKKSLESKRGRRG